MQKYFILLLLVTTIKMASGQAIRVFETVKDTNVELMPGETSIVDINSRIEVKLVKDVLLEKASIKAGINEELLARLERLNFILKNQIEILQILEGKVEAASQSDKINLLGDYSVLMNEFYNRLTQSEYSEIRHMADEYFNSYFQLRTSEKKEIDSVVYPNPQTYVIKNLSGDADEVLRMMGESEAFQKITFRLVAFINTRSDYMRKVHIENFDNYAAGEFYEVERWVTSFSDEDLAAFEETQKLSNKLNSMLNEEAANLNQLLRNNFHSIGCFQSLLKKLEALYNDRKNLFAADKQVEGETLLDNTLTTFSEFYTQLSGLNESNTAAVGNILGKYNKYHEAIIKAATAFPGQFDQVSNDFAAVPTLDGRSEINDFIAEARVCIDTLKKDIEKVKQIVNFTSHLLEPFKKTAEVADEIAGDAFSFGIDELPDKGYINLKTTGKRENGDELEIRLMIRTEEDTNKNSPGETIEIRTLTLQQVKIYSISKVTLILAAPFANSDIPLLEENRVQFAPAGSLLFKFGSRNSRAWNFINPGIGFNISTPDFNLDGTPDVGLGVIGTVLKDIISFGWSYNTNTNSQFWFIGLSIPVTLPGIPINTVQSKSVE